MSVPQHETVVVTGAASGIGKALVHTYLKAGDSVIAIDRNNVGLESLKQSFGTAFVDRLVVFSADVTQSNQIESAAQSGAEQIGKPTIWINNAGITEMQVFDKMTEESFQQVIDVNLMGVVNGSRVAMKVMNDPARGKIVNISSVAGSVACPYMTSYVASKHAVTGFTRALQIELHMAHSPLQAILVSPGFSDTAIVEPQNGFEHPAWLKKLLEDPSKVAAEIYAGIKRGDAEIQPTINGKVLQKLAKLTPQSWMVHSSRALVAKNWKELLGLNPIRK